MNRRLLASFVVLLLLLMGCNQKMVKPEADEVVPPEIQPKEVTETPVEKGETLIMKGVSLIEENKTEEALKTWKKALGFLNGDAELLNWLGVGYHKLGKYDSAKIYYEQAIAADQNHYQAYNNLGYTYFVEKNYHKAQENFEKALAINPYFEQASLNNKTCNKIIDGELTFKALELFEKAAAEDSLQIKLTYYKNAVTLDPSYVEAFNNMGVAFYYMGNVDSSIIYLNKAIEVRPDYPEANNNLGFILSQLGLDDKAVPLYLTALSIKTNYVVAMINLSDSYIRLKQYENADKILESAQKLSPENMMIRKRVRQLEYLQRQN
jgi:Flp pilus assembly protein TadD